MTDWQPYLTSVCEEYKQWWRFYTITDVVGKQAAEGQNEKSPLLNLEMMVQTTVRDAADSDGDEGAIPSRGGKITEEQLEKEKQPKLERLGVLEGLRKYAAEHLLLVGRPGSGKSTALVRLLLEEAQDYLQSANELAKIPVLVELRYFEISVIGLIRSFLKRHEIWLSVEAIERLLFEGKFLLLVDGVNELPSEPARLNVKMFRQDHPKTPMIFTTRDISLGGNLGVSRELEMQRLGEQQMRQFVCQYLPAQGEQMWRQMGERLKRLGETPLLLLMLCSVFKERQELPEKLGLVFRAFTRQYDRQIKEDVAVTPEDRSLWPELLECLAFEMIRGDEPTEILVAISEERARRILENYFHKNGVAQAKQAARKRLTELLKHHLIQRRADNRIEFRHQLIQEYYTAEKLRKQLVTLLQDTERLKREYLNYLKWTEPLKLVLELVKKEDSQQAISLIEIAVGVDLQLGAKLAGAVVEPLQSQTISLISFTQLAILPQIHLLKLTNSQAAIPGLLKALRDEDADVRWQAAEALGQLGSEAAIPRLLIALEHEDAYIRRQAAPVLGQLGSEAAIPGLLIALEDEDAYVRWRAAKALGQLGSETAIPGLLIALGDKEAHVRWRAAEALGQLDSEAAIPELLIALEHKDADIRRQAVEALGQLGSEAAIPGLLIALEDEDADVRSQAVEALGQLGSEAAIPGLLIALEDEDADVRSQAAAALGQLGSEAAIPELLIALEHGEADIRWQAAAALGQLGSEAAIPGLLIALEHEEADIRWQAVKTLCQLGSEAAIPGLLKALEHEDAYVRWRAAEALCQLDNEAAIPGLLIVLEHEDADIRRQAAAALGQLGSEAAIPELLIASDDEEAYVRSQAAEALSQLGSEAAIPGLLKALEHEEAYVRWQAAAALYQLGSEAAIPELLVALDDEDADARSQAAKVLSQLGSEAAIPGLLKILQQFLLRSTYTEGFQAIAEIQEKYKLYSYDLTQPIALSISLSISTVNILHLSDLHFGTLETATLWANQLAADLSNELSLNAVDTLILSGDIANYATSKEYTAAQSFIESIQQDLQLSSNQIVIVPGNHDLDWAVTNPEINEEAAYELKLRSRCTPEELSAGNFISEGERSVLVRNNFRYKQRLANFDTLYQAIKATPYPLDYAQQYTLDHLPSQNLLILGLNSAWNLDHHFKDRVSIHPEALSNALTQIRRNPDKYANCRKIAVWHHPLDSPYTDRITDQSFLEQLAVAGFRLFLHGHVHKAETNQFRYDMSTGGRKLDRICAGTFGAPTRELTTATPWQYNLLQFQGDTLTVRTRKRDSENGAWKPDARWGQGPGQSPLDYYTIDL